MCCCHSFLFSSSCAIPFRMCARRRQHTRNNNNNNDREKKKVPPETFIKYPLGIYFQITSHILNIVRFFFYLFSTVQCTRVFVPNFLPIYIRFVCMVYASIYISICDIHRTSRKFVSTSRLFFNIISRCCQFLALVCLSPRLHSFIIIISVSKNLFFLYFCFFCMIRIVCICM